jgi:type II secretory pathway component PulC
MLGYSVVRTGMMLRRRIEIFAPASAGATEEITAVEAVRPLSILVEDYAGIIDPNAFNIVASSNDISQAVETVEANLPEKPEHAVEAQPRHVEDEPHYVVVTKPRDVETKSQRAVVAKFRDIEEVLKRAVIEPYLVGGKTIGLKITGLEKVECAASLGLKNGDVIRSVNGHPLTSTEKAYEVFKEARSRSDMRVELLSDKKTKTLLFLLR